MFLSELVWERQGGGWGGLSGIDVAPDGRHYAMVGDGGQIFTGIILRDGDRLKNLIPRLFRGLRNTAGVPLPGDLDDAEGIALLPDGSFYVSFEGPARVWHYDHSEAPARPLPVHPDFRRLARNAALEALAVDGSGALYTLPELRPGAASFPIWRWEGGVWEEFDQLPASGGWLPVGADFGPEDRLYLLERRHLGPFGIESRVRRFPVGEAGLGPGETVLRTERGRHGNLEGIAVWTGEDGRLRLTMVADHGFGVSDLPTFVEYRLDE